MTQNSSSGESPLEKETLIAAVNASNSDMLTDIKTQERSSKSKQSFLNKEDVQSIIKDERYQIVELIGQGGMGKVYKARDLVLNRFVALKFLRNDTKDLLNRFLQEARAQARLDHKNICKVYEVGQRDEDFFIAMQYISGISLREAKKQMSLEQKICAIRDVAEALHQAHKLGLIHRDIKPANIMVEKLEDGSWHTYVMDFGLVKEIAADGYTLTGMVVGTPAFMPPEQAKGEIHRMDRRTDIYSLGATLYDLLVDQPPFSNTIGSNIFIDIVEKDIEPLRKRDNTIPLDLEIITMKCLEKEPQHRYDSAKALADELQRYLDGLPIQGKPTSSFYKLQKYVRKNRTLVIISIVAFTIVLIFSGLWINSKITESQRARVAQQFGQEIEKIDDIMQIAYLLPLHNIEQERKRVKDHIQKIERQMKEMGKVSEVSGNYALGRGYLALHEYKEALSYFEKSWNQGYHNSEIAYDMAQTLNALYKEALAEANMNDNAEIREAKRKEAIEQYRNLSVKYLKFISLEEVDSPAYVEAMLAFNEERYEEALSKAEQAYNQTQALYVAKKLQGDVYLISASDKFDKGKYAEASKEVELAGELFHKALEIAHSDESLYISESERLYRLLTILKEQGKPMDEIFNQAIDACDKALVANPQSWEAYHRKAELLWRKGEQLIDEEKDPSSVLLKAIEMGQMAVKINPKDYESYVSIGIATQLKGDYETSQGLNPISSFNDAIDYYKKSLLINPNYVRAYMEIGNTYWFKGDYENNHGLDSMESIDKAIDSYQKAIEHNKSLSILYDNAGIAYGLKARIEFEEGKNSLSSIDQAIKLHNKATELNPNRANNYNNLAIALSRLANYENSRGLDPRTSTKKAVEACEKAIKINPSLSNINSNIGNMYLADGVYEYFIEENPLSSFAKALKYSSEALNNNTKNFIVLSNLSSSYIKIAELLVEKDIVESKYIENAVYYTKQGLKVNPNYFSFYDTLARVYLLKATIAIKQNKSPEAFFNEALPLFRKSLSLNPRSFNIYANYGKFFYHRALWLNSQKRSLKEDVEQGLELINKSISMKSDDAETYIIKGKLLLLAAENNLFSEAVSTTSKEALKNFNKAIEINPLMKKECEQQINFAQKLIK